MFNFVQIYPLFYLEISDYFFHLVLSSKIILSFYVKRMERLEKSLRLRGRRGWRMDETIRSAEISNFQQR